MAVQRATSRREKVAVSNSVMAMVDPFGRLAPRERQGTPGRTAIG